MIRLKALLGKAFGMAGLRFSGFVAVLNLACGRADETGVLCDALSPALVRFYLGVDLRAAEIGEARQRWELLGGEMQFLEGDAARIGRMQSLPIIDLIFIRHQNYWHAPLVWESILRDAWARLRNGGYMVCTSYFDEEHALLLASMRQMEARLCINLRHGASRELPDCEGKSVDRWVAVWRKMEGAKNHCEEARLWIGK